jgi:hypothetical protein
MATALNSRRWSNRRTFQSFIQARLERAATEKQSMLQELHGLRRRQNSSAAGQTGSTCALRMQRPDEAHPDGPPRQNGATQGGNQRGNHRRARPRRDGTANMTKDREDLDVNLAFFAGAEDPNPVRARPWLMQVALE